MSELIQALLPRLSAGIEQLGLAISLEKQQQLLDFLQLLTKWNAHFNLTAITTAEKMLTHHLLDSLAVAPFISGKRILDVGSGAGFPGIPLALCFPEQQWLLLDSNGKKTRFLLQAKASLGLENVAVVQSRIEQFYAEECFDVIISRALGSIKELLAQTQEICCPGGHWLFMKGARPDQELAEIDQPYVVHALQVPELDAERHLVVVKGGLCD